MQLKTTGDLRGFLADVLIGIREGTVDATQANSISKVAAQINQSLSTEVQARIHLKSLGADDAGSMVIASDHVPDARNMIEPVQIKHQLPAADVVDPAVVPKREPVKDLAISLDDAAANYRRPKETGDKVWCDQCDMRVTVSQAVGCKSPHCKAKDAA